MKTRAMKEEAGWDGITLVWSMTTTETIGGLASSKLVDIRDSNGSRSRCRCLDSDKSTDLTNKQTNKQKNKKN